MAAFTLKIRETGETNKSKFASADALFAALDTALADCVARTDGQGQKSMLRDYEAIELVHSRLEVTVSEGMLKRRRGGIDVRRDGSVEGWMGRTSRTLIAAAPGETVVDALRRELTTGQ